MSIREKFEIPQRYKMWSYALMAVGVISIILLYVTHGAKAGHDAEAVHERARFWSSLLQNSVFFLLIVNAAMFMICATILAWAGWNISFRRVSEAIAACVPVMGVICGVILLAILFGGDHAIYHWADEKAVDADHILKQKSPFLNKTF